MYIREVQGTTIRQTISSENNEDDLYRQTNRRDSVLAIQAGHLYTAVLRPGEQRNGNRCLSINKIDVKLIETAITSKLTVASASAEKRVDRNSDIAASLTMSRVTWRRGLGAGESAPKMAM